MKCDPQVRAIEKHSRCAIANVERAEIKPIGRPQLGDRLTEKVRDIHTVARADDAECTVTGGVSAENGASRAQLGDRVTVVVRGPDRTGKERDTHRPLADGGCPLVRS